MDLWDYHLTGAQKYDCQMPLPETCMRKTCEGCKYAKKKERV